MKPATPITLLIAEDHTVVREGLRSLLAAADGVEVVGEAVNGRQAVELAKTLRPAVVLMDIAMPVLNGLQATRELLAAVPETRVLILSAHADDAYVEQAVASGAAGYLIKQTSIQTLVDAIQKVHGGGTFFSPAVHKRFLKRHQHVLSHKGRAKTVLTQLTPRETEVLQLIAEGEANKQMAARLGISVKTVEKHRDRLMQKLDIHDTAGLTRYAIGAGVIESSVQLTILEPDR
jgi:DNA-binding NarL/FixJ family response regulator